MSKLIVVVGAGLSGLYAARLLANAGQRVMLIEARSKIGGRVLEGKLTDPKLHADLGPTWYWPEWNPRMRALVQLFGLRHFPQHRTGADLYEQANGNQLRHVTSEAAGPSAYRIQGGMIKLLERLRESQIEIPIEFNARLIGIRLTDNKQLELTIEQHGMRLQIQAHHVICTIPPRLLLQDVEASPAWPTALMRQWENTPTWMAPHAKFVAIYPTAFWREAGYSGHAISERGPLGEIHDASDSAPALFGFFHYPAHRRRQFDHETLKQLALQQLAKLFGPQALKPLVSWTKDWAVDPLTASARDSAPLRCHPNYCAPPQPASWKGLLYFAGTECAPTNGGFLEGALEAAENAVAELLKDEFFTSTEGTQQED